MKSIFVYGLILCVSLASAQEITVTFNADPGAVECTSSPLRYGKKHALTFDQDDNLRDVYTAILPLFTGGTPMLIDDTDTTFDVSSAGVYFNDGFGNQVPFKANTASWVYSGNDVEYWQWATSWPRGGRLGYPDLHEMLDNGFGICSHGYYGDINTRGDDTVALGATLYRNWLERETGEVPLSFVQPGGTTYNTDLWTEKWFEKGALYGVLGSGGVYCPERVDNLDFSSTTEAIIQGRYSLEGKTSADLIAMVNSLMSEDDHYWQRCFGHNIEEAPTSFIDYDQFKTFVQYVQTNYADDVWVPSTSEIISYLHVRDNVDYTVSNGGSSEEKLVNISTDNIPNNIKHRQLTFSVTSSQDIASVDFGGLTGNYRQTGVNEYLFDVDLSTEGDPISISSISGNTSLNEYTTGEEYSVTPVSGATYEWIISGDAEIVSGENTSSIVVNFAEENVTMTARVENADGNADYADLSVETIRTLYVKPTASGSASGTSWANAMSDLQAAVNTESISQIWVAAGTYTAADTNGFIPVENVDVYGGFAGTEEFLEERAKSDLDANGQIDPWEYDNVTLLTADNDGVADNYTNWPEQIGTSMDENANHVIYQSLNFTTKTIWDGFTLVGGNADGILPHNRGAAVYARRELEINNSIIKNCISEENGGGMYLYQTSSDGVKIYECRSLNSGGAIFSSDSRISDTYVSDCYAAVDAGGIENYGANSVTTHTTVTNCESGATAGGIYNYQGEVSYSIVTDNRTVSNGGGIYNNNATVDHVTVSGNSTSGYSTGGGIFSYVGTVSNCDIFDNSVVAGGGGILVKSGGLIENCRVYNNTNTASYADGGGVTLESGSTLRNSVVFNNHSLDFGGGVYNSSSNVINCSIANNSSGDNGGGIYNYNTAMVLNTVLWGNVSANTDNQINAQGTITYTASQDAAMAGTGNIIINALNSGEADSPSFTSPTEFVGLSNSDAAKESALTASEWNIESNSILINQGSDSGAPEEDIDGFTRSTTDIGAYEYHLFSTPGLGASSITVELSYTDQLDLSWTNGNGTERAVFMKLGNSGSALPVNNSSYEAAAIFGSGTEIGSSGWYCIYNGEDNVVTVTGLVEGADYRVMVCEYNGTAGSELYLTEQQTNNPVTVTTSQLDIPSSICLSDFKAEFKQGVVVLSWTTESEIENSHFNIYKNGEYLAKVTGSGTCSETNSYHYYDKQIVGGHYIYELEDVAYSGASIKHEAFELDLGSDDLLPDNYSLGDPYPNPFNPVMTIAYSLPVQADVRIAVLNLRGQVVKSWNYSNKTAGWYTQSWRAGNTVGSGVYIVRIQSGEYVQSKKLILLK